MKVMKEKFTDGRTDAWTDGWLHLWIKDLCFFRLRRRGTRQRKGVPGETKQKEVTNVRAVICLAVLMVRAKSPMVYPDSQSRFSGEETRYEAKQREEAEMYEKLGNMLNYARLST